MMPTPVKEEALKHGIPVLQPVKVRDPEFVEELKNLAPDIIIVAAFGQIIPKSILDMPRFGCINIHASLLPKYRGAAPIQQAVIDGEKESGVTIMQIDVYKRQALEVLKYINDKVNQYKKEDGYLYAIYGTPAESLCGLQVEQFRKMYGIIEGVSDRPYAVSYTHLFCIMCHMPVWQP